MNRSIKLSYIIFVALVTLASVIIGTLFFKANHRIESLIDNSKVKDAILAVSQINKEFSDLKLSTYEYCKMSTNSIEEVQKNLDIFSMKVNQIHQGKLRPFFQHIENFETYIDKINNRTAKLHSIIHDMPYLTKEVFQAKIIAELEPLSDVINQLRFATIQYSSDSMRDEQEIIQDFFEFLVIVFVTFLILLLFVFVFIYIQIRNLMKSYATLSQTTEQLEAANKTKSSFLAHISHELRTPLNAIIGFSDIIRKEYLGKIEQKEYVEYSEEIHESSNHLLTMINDILDMSKIDAGEREITPGKVQIISLIEQSLKMLQLKSEEKHLTITKNYSKDTPFLYIDPLAIKQSLINILSNSIKFTDNKGEIKITIEDADKKHLKISIADNGIGMSEEGVKRALTPFQQASDDKYNRGSSGTGLGLPITKSLIELNNGQFIIESEAGSGTTISFLLPKYNASKK